jgi:hypothetical protein
MLAEACIVLLWPLTLHHHHHHHHHTTRKQVPQGQPPLAWPSVHAPWYGYLFWTLMTAGAYGRDADSSFVASNVDRWENCTANIKVSVCDEAGWAVFVVQA